jgi:hypothetical protein
VWDNGANDAQHKEDEQHNEHNAHLGADDIV